VRPVDQLIIEAECAYDLGGAGDQGENTGHGRVFLAEFMLIIQSRLQKTFLQLVANFNAGLDIPDCLRYYFTL
jgi:hypothetical protein